jgi:hypothetical protein
MLRPKRIENRSARFWAHTDKDQAVATMASMAQGWCAPARDDRARANRAPRSLNFFMQAGIRNQIAMGTLRPACAGAKDDEARA